jgi:hypothetical protein
MSKRTPDLLSALRTAESHIEHMAAWISARPAGYSFESLNEDLPGIRAAIAKAEPSNTLAQGLAGHSGATENTGSASSDAAVRPANSSPDPAKGAV